MQKKWECQKECRFCQIVKGKRTLGKIDTPIMESENFIAVISVGAIVEGWTLIFPKKHILSMRSVYEDPEFIKFANDIIKKQGQIYGKKSIIFEHGANHEGSVTACGTNHAHLHIIPYETSLLDEMEKDGIDWKVSLVKDIKKNVKEEEYWFYAENVETLENASGVFHIIDRPESQYFRKLIAKKEDCQEKFDYKQYAFLDIAEKTYDLYER